MLNSMDGKGIKYSFADNSNFYINLNDYFTNASELTKSKLDTLNLIKKSILVYSQHMGHLHLHQAIFIAQDLS